MIKAFYQYSNVTHKAPKIRPKNTKTVRKEWPKVRLYVKGGNKYYRVEQIVNLRLRSSIPLFAQSEKLLCAGDGIGHGVLPVHEYRCGRNGGPDRREKVRGGFTILSAENATSGVFVEVQKVIVAAVIQLVPA